jgi:hypothetical protein
VGAVLKGIFVSSELIDRPEVIASGGTRSGTKRNGEAAAAVIVGVLGGLVSAGGYLVYSNLPEPQRESLRQSVRNALTYWSSELRNRVPH